MSHSNNREMELTSVDDDMPESEVFEYLRNHDVAHLVDGAVQQMAKERPTSARMWLASYFAGEPGCETLLGRLAAMEKEVRKLELSNRALRSGGVEDPIHTSEPCIEPAAPRNLGGVEKKDASNIWLTPPSACVFEEYIKKLELGPSSAHIAPSQQHKLDNKCCLIVLDMQNDFIPLGAKNPDGGRCAIPEAEQTAANIVALMKKFAENGGRVIATRDYHPSNHCSFISQDNGKFPPHCVQGSRGSEFYEPIGNCLKELLDRKETRSRVSIAFKGFHEDIDSFGALSYTDAQLKSHDLLIQRAAQGASMAHWTGAFILHASNTEAWDDNAEPNAPPDVLALERARETKATRLSDHLKPYKRVYVCGVALDQGVIDTAVNAVLADIPEVYIVLDATRPTYVPGFGIHGSGFLQVPRRIVEKLQTPKGHVKLVPTREFLISPHEVSQLVREHAASESVRGSSEGGGMPPHALGPFSVRKARAIRGGIVVGRKPTNSLEGGYDLSHTPMLRALKEMNVQMSGSLSATSPINYFGVERRRVDIPDDADSFCWAYPLNGAHHLTEHDRGVLQCLHNANFSFPVFGGFLYLKDGEVIGANALCLGEGMSFDPPQKWPVELKKHFIQMDRFKQVTFPALIKAGCHWFAWIKPKEIKGFDHGGFGYLMHQYKDDESHEADKDVWFPLRDMSLPS